MKILRTFEFPLSHISSGRYGSSILRNQKTFLTDIFVKYLHFKLFNGKNKEHPEKRRIHFEQLSKKFLLFTDEIETE